MNVLYSDIEAARLGSRNTEARVDCCSKAKLLPLYKLRIGMVVSKLDLAEDQDTTKCVNNVTFSSANLDQRTGAAR